jgi:hypothetical protein
MRKNAFCCCKYPNVGFRVSPSTAIKPKKNGTNTMNQISEIKNATKINGTSVKVGDRVRYRYNCLWNVVTCVGKVVVVKDNQVGLRFSGDVMDLAVPPCSEGKILMVKRDGIERFIVR